ncbi:MAG TPA: response regulator [Candidatus Acidoferrum sp.]|nr:response regulator [Candidatus Acidoferrum sp.]
MNILIVDDMQTDRQILGGIVLQTGHQPIYASDGTEVLSAVKASRPALILLDVVMAGQDGYKTCRSLKADPETARIPVVLVTSKSSESDKFWGRRQGAEDFVVKPYRAQTIVDTIHRYVR